MIHVKCAYVSKTYFIVIFICDNIFAFIENFCNYQENMLFLENDNSSRAIIMILELGFQISTSQKDIATLMMK